MAIESFFVIGVDEIVPVESPSEDISVANSHQLRLEESWAGVLRYSGTDISATSNNQHKCDDTDPNLEGFQQMQKIPLGWS